MAVANEQILTLARIGAQVIEFQLQLSMTDATAREACYEIWPFGYCYGAFEALARHNGMDVVEAHLLIALGFEELIPGRDGRKRLEQAAAYQENNFFVEGRAHGSDDFSKFVTDKEYRPLMLMGYFSFGKPAPIQG